MTNLPKEHSFEQKPWECPRCGRINAPFNPTCFCNPTSNDYTTIAGICKECGSFYGMLNGKIKHCHCGKDVGISPEEDKEVKDMVKKVAKPKYTFKEVENYMKHSHCTNCGGYHGVFNGKAVECINLQAGMNNGLAGFQ